MMDCAVAAFAFRLCQRNLSLPQYPVLVYDVSAMFAATTCNAYRINYTVDGMGSMRFLLTTVV
jgi:hypothetical protein